jgi:uncharacterized protein (DUF2147 family)
VFVIGFGSQKSKGSGAAYSPMLNKLSLPCDSLANSRSPHFLRISVACRIDMRGRYRQDRHFAMHLFDFHKTSSVFFAALAVLALLVPTVSAQAPAADVTGLWIDHTGQGAVEIAPCGDHICGRVVWLKNPHHKSKSGKLICGTQVLGDLQRRPNNAWEAGWIYNPEDEERFSAALKLANADTLMVTGYLGIKLLGETFTWRRSPTELERCGQANRPT